jgi:hypothetical protein
MKPSQADATGGDDIMEVHDDPYHNFFEVISYVVMHKAPVMIASIVVFPDIS